MTAPSSGSIAHSAPRKPHSCDLELEYQSHSVRFKGPLFERSVATIYQRLSELRSWTDYQEVQHYKQILLVNSLSEARQTLPQMWLHPLEEIVKHVKSNDDWNIIITKEMRSHLKGFSYIKGKKRKKKEKKRRLDRGFVHSRGLLFF